MDGKVLPPQHQVFINFRGDELHNSFISHLVDAFQRNRINIFTDKQEKKGENISNLFKRIEESKIALAVFSKRYTESRWCLDELVKINQCVDLDHLKVLPIFYNVTTDDVKRLKGEFGIHFSSLEEECYRSNQPDNIDRWKEALVSVSGKIGLTFHHDDKSLSEKDFIGDIVKEVLIMLQDIPSEQTPKSLDNKLPERRENSLIKKNSKKSLKAQKANLANPYKAELISSSGSNSLIPQAIPSEHGRPNITIQFSETASPANALRLSLPSVQSPSNYTVVQPSYGSDFTGTRSSYNGFPVRYGNNESAGGGDSSSMSNNSKKPVKPSKRNLPFTGTNGWPS